jgi:hypothetical protein
MMKLPGPQKSWLDTYPEPIMSARIARDPNFASRYGLDFERVRQSPIRTGALYWKYKSAAFFDYARARLPMALVSYEALVTDPEPVLRGITGFLGIAWNDSMLHHERLNHTELFADGITVGGTDSRAPIHSRSVTAWRELLSEADAAEIDEIAGPLWATFGEMFGSDVVGPSGVVLSTAGHLSAGTCSADPYGRATGGC